MVFSSHETKSQVIFTDPTSSVVRSSSSEEEDAAAACVVNFSLKRLFLLQFSSDFDHTWYDHWANVLVLE